MEISIKDLTFAYGEKQIFSHFTLNVRRGERLWLSAKSGFGKTTLLRLICGLETPQGGEITMSPDIKIATVFQEDRLLPWLTVADNIGLVLSHLPCSARRAHVMEYLSAVGLQDEADSFPSQLSGGMARRVALARALAAQWDLLLLDEPFVGLDADVKAKIAGFISEKARGKTMILVTHDAEEAALLSAEQIDLEKRPE